LQAEREYISQRKIERISIAMKRLFMMIVTIITLVMAATVPALAAEEFDSPDAGQFGKPTSVDEVASVGGFPSESDNIKRSKDSAFIPPPFGSPSSNTPGADKLLTPDISGVTPHPGGYTVSGGSIYVPADSANPGGSLLPPPPVDSFITSDGGGSANKFTTPEDMYNTDGSIGTLGIPKLGVSAKVYEDESLENLRKGVGHFKHTSCWDGNVGFAAHNRGQANYFGSIHTLNAGDRITYSTKLGVRTYEVYFVGQVDETDLSRLGRTDTNIVSLYTCVRNVPAMRWCVQAAEIR
jgi:sortase A